MPNLTGKRDLLYPSSVFKFLRFRDGLDHTVRLTLEIKLFFKKYHDLFSNSHYLYAWLCMQNIRENSAGDNLLLCQEFLIFGVLKRSDSTVRQCFVEFYVHRRCNISSSVKKSGKFSQLSENVFLVQFRGQNAACHIPVNLRFSYETVEFIL